MMLLHALLVAGLLIGCSESRPGQCNCDCGKPALICGWNHKTSEFDTFLNYCHMRCINCTSNKNYILVSQGECPKKTSTPKSPKTPK